MPTPREPHWSEDLADLTEARLSGSAPGAPIVCASGISPSGPIHMGNLREVFTTHLVVEALRRRGHTVTHLHSWDDYDRLRKVPAGIEESFARHVGMPLAEIPDPLGEKASWAERFIDEFSAALAELGIETTPRRQSQLYTAGTYNAGIRRAMEGRETIFDILAEQQTEGRHEEPAEERRRRYFPFKPYCERCHTDETRVLDYRDETVRYTCRCGHEGTMSLADGAPVSGKLVWKVDWPMRWAHEGVAFEPAGEDHHAPTGSFTVGRAIAREIYGYEPPATAVYSFVTLQGRGGKMSGSAGGAATPAAALSVFEPVVVRWPYVQRVPTQSFSFDLQPHAVQRTYDHWDQFAASALEPDPRPDTAIVHRLTVETTAGAVHRTPRPLSFRLLTAVADLTQANREQIGRILAAHLEEPVEGAERLLGELEPRLTCAIRYATELIEPQERTAVRERFDGRAWDELDESTRRGIQMLLDRLPSHWSPEGIANLTYAIPKEILGLPVDTPTSPEVRGAQRQFFKGVYRLLCGAENGPRLPTLMLSIGLEHTRRLLGEGGEQT